MSRKIKNDAGKTLGERTEKQRDTPRALQVGHKEHREQPLSEKSHTQRDMLSFITPPSFGRTQASTDKECCNCVERGHLTR
jgi:hypothetical protein